MRVWVTSVSTVIMLSVACAAGAYTPPPGSPLANREHPRLWLTRANLPEIRAKLGGDFRSEYQAFVSELDSRISAPKDWSYWADDVSNFAFVYQVGSVPGISYGNSISAYGDRAKFMLVSAVADSAYDGLKNYGLAYDWVFDRMSPGERTSVVNFLKGMPDGTEGSGGNPYTEVRARSEHIVAGLAFWGDRIDDAAADTMVSKYATLIEGPAGVLGAGSFYSGTDGGWSRGFSYSWNQGNALAAPRVMEAWRTSNGYSRAAVFTAPNANVVRYYAQWVLYNILPPTTPCSTCAGGYNFPIYRTHYMNAAQMANTISSDFDAILAAVRLYKSIDPNVAGLVQWLIDNRTRALKATGYDGRLHAVFSHFIAGEKGITPRSPSDLGLLLTKHFTNSGWVVMRTGWGSPSDTVITFTASPFARAAGSYTNYNNGAFTIDRRGPLALHSGSAIHHDYSSRTWAGNTMIFPDPRESETPPTVFDFWDQGGQRYQLFPQLNSTTQLTPGSPHDIGGIKRFQARDEFDYVFADVTRAYNGPANNDGRNTLKVASFTRHLVYFHRESSGDSDRVVVFDRALTTDTRFEKRWLLHPSASGSAITINGTSTTLRAGKTEYTGADLVTATNTAGGSSGKLYLKTLLPVARKIVLIGGPGSEFENPYGVNDTREALPVDPQYQGTYRVEVIPAARNTYDTFLNVLEATDAGAGPTPTALLTGSGMVAARVGGKIAAFSPTEGLIETGYITVDAAGTYGVLISDLAAGAAYDVGGRTMTASSAGTIYVEVSAAGGSSRLTVTRVGSAPPPAPPAPPTRVEILKVP